MQFRELGERELDSAFGLLSSLRLDLTSETFASFIHAQSPHTYRPLGAFERGELRVYAGVSIRENLELGRHMIIDDFVAREGYAAYSAEMVNFLSDYAKMHGCKAAILWGNQMGITLEDLRGFRPKRDGFIKFL